MRGGVPVGRLQPLNLKHGPSRDTARTTSGCRMTSAGLPLAMTWPASSTTTRSARATTARMMCSTNTTVVPRSRMSRTSRVASAISDGVSPESTSSSRTSRGSEASARASSRNFRWWRFSAEGSRFARSARPVNSSQRSASRSAARRSRARTAEHPRDRHVVADGQAGEGPGDLVGPRDAPPGDLVRHAAGDLDAADDDAPAVRPVVAADDVDQGGLAGAVGADEPQDLPFPDLQAHPAQRLDSAEGLPDVGADQQRRRADPSGRRAVAGAGSPAAARVPAAGTAAAAG